MDFKLQAIDRIGALTEQEKLELLSTAIPLFSLSPFHESSDPEEYTDFKKTGSAIVIHPRNHESSARMIPAYSFA